MTRVIANRIIASTNEELEQMAEIEDKIKKVTVNIEEASELKDYLDEIRSKSKNRSYKDIKQSRCSPNISKTTKI